MLNYIFLATSISIDSLGIGLTYGIRNTKIFFFSKFILFIISILITSFSVFLGNALNSILPANYASFIGIAVLIFLGLWIIYQSIKEKSKKQVCVQSSKKIYNFFIKSFGITIQIIRDPICSDLDGSKRIDWREALYLGFALSFDSVGVGIGGSIAGLTSILFPILVAIFQLIFLSVGILFGKKLQSTSKIPSNIWSVISGIILICIGISKAML